MEVTIEWRHYEKGGETCDRCSVTGSSLQDTVVEVGRELAGRGIAVVFTETILPEGRMALSNTILINGVPLEASLDDATAAETPCPSCSRLTGSETWCRTLEYKGKTYEAIPAELIRKAVYRAVGLNPE